MKKLSCRISEQIYLFNIWFQIVSSSMNDPCNDNTTVMVKMSSSYRFPLTSEYKNPINYGMESLY